MLQPFPQFLLLVLRKLLEGGIVLQSLFLLVRGQVFVLSQPVAHVTLFSARLGLGPRPRWPGYMLLRRRDRMRRCGRRWGFLRRTDHGDHDRRHQDGNRQVTRNVISPVHDTSPTSAVRESLVVCVLRIVYHVLLQIQVVKQIEISVQVVVLVQTL